MDSSLSGVARFSGARRIVTERLSEEALDRAMRERAEVAHLKQPLSRAFVRTSVTSVSTSGTRVRLAVVAQQIELRVDLSVRGANVANQRPDCGAGWSFATPRQAPDPATGTAPPCPARLRRLRPLRHRFALTPGFARRGHDVSSLVVSSPGLAHELIRPSAAARRMPCKRPGHDRTRR